MSICKRHPSVCRMYVNGCSHTTPICTRRGFVERFAFQLNGQMIDANIEGVEFIAANTHAQALRSFKGKTALQIGSSVTKGLGAGANPEVGRQAALEDRDHIIELLHGADMVFITAGMGGGTGTGAAPVIAQAAKELGIYFDEGSTVRRDEVSSIHDYLTTIREQLLADDAVVAALGAEGIEAQFDEGYHTKHVDTIFARVFGET